MKSFEERGALVLGLGADARPALRSWGTNLGGIAHSLLSDFWPHGQVARAYGIFNEDTGMCTRSVTIIDPQGTVRYHQAYQGVLPDPNAILEELSKLQG